MRKTILRLFVLALAGLLLISCSPASNTKATPTQAAAAPAAPESSATPAATPTVAATKVLLVAPQGTDAASIQAKLAELAGPSGMTVETRQGLQKSDLTSEIKAVVLLSAPADLADLLAAAPQVQFVVVASADLPAAGNLTVIRQKLENQAFVAGFTSVLLSTDYRAAGLLPADGPLGASLKEAFVNGGRYFCGVCAPGWPLNVYYPLAVELPSASDSAAWLSAAAGPFDEQKVEVFYLAPEAALPDVVNGLAGKLQNEKAIILVGAQTPPDGLQAQWAASIHFDLASVLTQVWPDVAAGKGGSVQEAPLLIDNINADLLGEGKQRLIKEVAEKLKSGEVTPFSIPLQ